MAEEQPPAVDNLDIHHRPGLAVTVRGTLGTITIAINLMRRTLGMTVTKVIAVITTFGNLVEKLANDDCQWVSLDQRAPS